MNQPLLSLRVSTDLRRRLHAEADVTLEYSDQPADCAGARPAAGAAAARERRLRVLSRTLILELTRG